MPEDAIDKYIRAGLREARRHLTKIRSEGHQQELTFAYAAGIAQGIAEWMASEGESDHRIFNLFTEIADEAIAPGLPKGK